MKLHPLLYFGLFASQTSAQYCLHCTKDACAAAVGTDASGVSVCAAWLSVTVTRPGAVATSTEYADATTTTTTTVVSSITVTTTSTSTLLTGSTVTSTSTSSIYLAELDKGNGKGEKRSPAGDLSPPPPPALSTNPGIIVPNTIPAGYSGPCDGDLSAFFSACICGGATRTTVTVTVPTATTTTTIVGGSAVTTTSSLVTTTESATAVSTSVSLTTTTTQVTASTAPTGLLQVQGNSGSAVDGYYVFVNGTYQSSANAAIAMQFTASRDLATVFTIDTATSALAGYRSGWLGSQSFYTGQGSGQSSQNFYNAFVLAPSGFAAQYSLPVPTCRNTGPSGLLQCVETAADDLRDTLQYCPGDQSWFGPYGYKTLGFLILDGQVDPNCTQVNLKFVDS